MTRRDFVYWLQGHFEIRSRRQSAAWSAIQVDIIKKHLELSSKSKVDSVRFPDANVGAEFCTWLADLFDESDCSGGLTGDSVDVIRRKLNDTFKHVIDPTFSNRADLATIHNGEGDDDDGGDEAMC